MKGLKGLIYFGVAFLVALGMYCFFDWFTWWSVWAFSIGCAIGSLIGDWISEKYI